MHAPSRRWEQLYGQVPLCDMPRHFAAIADSPYLREYLETVLRYCPSGARACEVGVGSGCGAIWLSLRGVQATGIDNAPGLVERARAVNDLLGGRASFRVGDLFDLYEAKEARYQVIHHQGVLEHFFVPQMRAALAQQVASAAWVVFSVPSVYYPFEPEFGDERLLPLEEWEWILPV
jgi:2-polyprenyl-3-methyl-5-hydroxy-6-metoxy-1,4-benzoquinol methylase